MNARVAWAVLAALIVAGTGLGFAFLWSGQREIAGRLELVEKRLAELTARPGANSDSATAERSVAVVPHFPPNQAGDDILAPALVGKLLEVAKVEVVPLNRVLALRLGGAQEVRGDPQALGRRLGAQYVLTFHLSNTNPEHVHFELFSANTGLLLRSQRRQMPGPLPEFEKAAPLTATEVAAWVKEKVAAGVK
jgi:hypothetical protein